MHRDLKPDNVVLKSAISNDVIKIVDFGLATFAGSEQVGVCGTPGYIAPEVFTYNETKQSMYDCKCDVFSAGAIMFKMYVLNTRYQGYET
jgi:serine/threonine protein kinase